MAVVAHSSEAMRRLARAVEGATTEAAGALKPEEAMRSAAMVSSQEIFLLIEQCGPPWWLLRRCVLAARPTRR